MYPYLSPSTATRARAIVGRLGLSFMPWKQDSLCPLCDSEKETMEHFTARCQALSHIRNPLITDLCKLFEREGKPPPVSDREVTFAFVNGDRYVSDHRKQTIVIRNLNAQNLCSRFFQKMYTERDVIITTTLMEDN